MDSPKESSSENDHLFKRNRTVPSYGSKETTERHLPDDGESVNLVGGDMDTIVEQHRKPRAKYEEECDGAPGSEFESLDYDYCENHLLLDEERTKGPLFVTKKNTARWFIFLLIGIFTACIACIIDVSIAELSKIKYQSLKKFVDQCASKNCLYIPYLLLVASNVVPVAIGSILVAYLEPVAAGSGIPQVKCYLNGVKIPRLMRVKTLAIKVVGVITSVVGGLAVGKEGPMIHSGAIVAAGISQGKTSTFKRDLNVFTYFREDHEKRDFVSGGAAAGVAAAFGAPVGGVLFSLEEGASFWNQSLTWRIFFASMTSTFTLNVILSAYHARPGDLSYAGLLNFGRFSALDYQLSELPVFLIMGAAGGLMGAAFNQMNHRLTLWRNKFVRRRWLRVIEAVIVAAMSGTLGFTMLYFVNDCKPLGQDPTEAPIQMFCGDGEYNAMGALWFQTPEASVRSLFHDPIGSHRAVSVALFFVLYLLLSCWTYGLSVSSGLFIPSLLTGAAWGRLAGMGLGALFPGQSWADPGKYALLGAAAQLGGVVRMTISLTVILIEATGDITFGLPLMLTLIMAKWVGDLFNEGIYDIHIGLQGVPLLPWAPPPMSHAVYASEVMASPVTCLRTVESVANVEHQLTLTQHNGFPVTDPPMPGQVSGTVRGLILRSQLITLLTHKVFNERAEVWNSAHLTLKMFRDDYPRYPSIQYVNITAEDRKCTIDLRPFMNPSPYTVQHCASLPRVFRLFRALGLRHLIVTNDSHQVVGVVTRQDLVRWSPHHKRPMTH